MAQTVKNLPAIRRPRFNQWVGKILWRREWQPTPVFLPGKPHGQRSLVGYSPWGPKELDRTVSNTHTHTHRNFPGGPVVKNLTAWDTDSIPGLERFLMQGSLGSTAPEPGLQNPQATKTEPSALEAELRSE